MPPDQAQAQVQPQLDKQNKQISDKASTQRKQLDQNATDPRLTKLRTDIEHERREEGDAAARQHGRARRRC